MTFEQVKKKARKTYKKAKRFVKKYIRFLVRHTKAKDYSVLIYTILGLIGIILIISLIVSGIGSLFKKDDKKKKPTTTSEITSQLPVSEEQPDIKTEAQAIYEKNKNLLILVNEENPLNLGYTFTHHTLNCGMDVDERIYSDMLQMLTDLNNADLHYTIVSAYRSRDEQTTLINQRVSELVSQGMSEDDAYTEVYKTVQKAGTSEHETGLCFDIVSEGSAILDDTVASQDTVKWLTDNCYKYGFILRYPLEKESITGIAYEPWHFRYVGKDAALFMHTNELTLEEFHQLLNKEQE